jgi:hypothetical protein
MEALSDLPIILCEPAGAASWRFWCPHCRKHHTHGAGEGHRVAHCTSPASPFKATGYSIRLAPGARHDEEQRL